MAEQVERGKGGQAGGWLHAAWNTCLVVVLLFLVLVVGAVGAVTWLFNDRVLSRIERLDYGEFHQRLDRYRSYFDSLAQEGHQVVSSPPWQVEGKWKFSWVVRFKGERGSTKYTWEYDIEAEQFTCLSEAAWELDRELGFDSEKGF